MRIRIQFQIQDFDDQIGKHFSSKIAGCLSPGFPEGRPSYRRSLQPSKENIQHFKT
jgi:hypothetical protein